MEDLYLRFHSGRSESSKWTMDSRYCERTKPPNLLRDSVGCIYEDCDTTNFSSECSLYVKIPKRRTSETLGPSEPLKEDRSRRVRDDRGLFDGGLRCR